MSPRKQQLSLEQRTVNLTAIKVDSNKLPTSVFRQIPCENIWDKNYKQRGKPWGNVNYFWEKEYGDLHILWQLGGSLYRSLHRKPNEHILEQKYNLQAGRSRNLESLALDATASLKHAKSRLQYAIETLDSANKETGLVTKTKMDISENIRRDEERVKTRQTELEIEQLKEAEALKKASEARHLFNVELEAWERAYEHLLTLPQLYLA
jgi:hypothetical protein